MDKVFMNQDSALSKSRNQDVNQAKKTVLTPTNTAQKVGYGAEQLAEFLIPGSASAKVGKAASTGIKLATKSSKLQTAVKVGSKALTEAGVVGGQSTMQKGEIDDNVVLNGIVAGMFPIAGAALSGAKKAVLKPVGEKIQQTVIRPSAKDLSDGFKVENLTKYGVGGSLKDTVAKTHTNINKLVSELNEKLQGDKSFVNLNDALEETISSLGKNKASNFGDTNSIAKVIEGLKGEIDNVTENGLVNLVDATNVKRGAGAKGAWSYNRPEPDATAIETVYTTFYNKLKTAIEKAAPDGVKDINKKISEHIPISNAALRRLPVEQRNNIISLTDSMGLFSAIFDPKALALIGANKLSKSGKFGQFLVDVANKKPKTTIGKRIFDAD